MSMCVVFVTYTKTKETNVFINQMMIFNYTFAEKNTTKTILLPNGN